MAHWRISDPSPRVRVVHATERVADARAQISRFFSEWFEPATHVILGPEIGVDGAAKSTFVLDERVPVEVGHSDAAPALHPISMAEVVSESPSTLVVRAYARESGGWLVVNDAWADGWIATVDGVVVPVERANGVVRAVRLDAGAHEVRFSYRPKALLAGIVVSGIAVVVVVGLFAVGRFGRRGSVGSHRGATEPEAPVGSPTTGP